MELKVLKKVISEILSVDPEEITEDTTFINDLGADSLDIYQIAMNLEEELDLEIPSEEVELISTVGDAVALLKRMLE